MLWQSNTPLSPQPNEGTQLPATFGDTFDTSWREGLLVTSGITQNNARAAALDNYLDEVRQTSGQDIGAAVGSDLQFPQLRLDAARDAVSKLKQDKPGLQIPDLTDDELDRRAASIAGLSHDAFAEMSAREKTFGGKVGMFAGGLLAGAGDPLNLIFAPVPEAKLGIVATAALWAGLGTESAAVNELVNAQFRERAIPGYIASGAPAANIAEAAAGGAVLGGLFKGVGAVWSRMKTGEWPRSVRDAGNIVESEANIQESNVLLGVEGAAAHREALGKAIDDIVAGRPIEVPERVGSLMSQSAREGGIAPDPVEGSYALSKIPRDNYSTKLSDYTSGLYREMNIDNALPFIDPGVGGYYREELFLSNSRDTALGQGENKGILVELDANKLTGKINKSKPGWEAAWQSGAAEFTGRLDVAPPSAVKSFEIMNNAQISRSLKERLTRHVLPYLESKGWTKENIDGGIKYTAPRAAGQQEEPTPLLPTEAKPTIVSPYETPQGSAISGPARELISPRAVADQLTPAAIQQTLADPAHSAGLMADLERIRDSGTKPQMVAIGTDAAGEPQYQLLDAAIQEAKDYENAASQIESCVNPPAEEP